VLTGGLEDAEDLRATNRAVRGIIRPIWTAALRLNGKPSRMAPRRICAGLWSVWRWMWSK